MSYFELSEAVEIQSYPFDFHSHFSGILPLESEIKLGDNKFKGDGFFLEKGDKLSIIGIISRKIIKEKPKLDKKENEVKEESHYRLFGMVLKKIIGNNPLNATEFGDYKRGECAAENIYIACCLLLQNIGFDTDYDIRKPDIYNVVLTLLNAKRTPIKNEKNAHVVAYFNRKIFSANKYTPFDDAYWVRGAVQDDEVYKVAFSWTTLYYLYASGIRYAQIAAGVKDIVTGDLNNCLVKFNSNLHTSYKMLAHSPHVYSSEKVFENQLNDILGLFEPEAPYKSLVGIDLLSPEIKTGLYGVFLKFLKEKKEAFKNYVKSGGSCKKIIIHIHCGEGGGTSEENRSLSGYFFSHAPLPKTRQFCNFLAAYAKECYQNTVSRQAARERERGNLGKEKKDYGDISSLFDELFYLNALSFDGLQLHRFDITSQRSQDLVAYNAKTNITHLCAELDKPDDGSSYYKQLCDSIPDGADTPYSFRIGHAYYDRNYVVSKFPALYFDTNLGSNFITGASGLFDSAQIYRLNNGFRHLNGQIDTDIIDQTTGRVAYMGIERLNKKQMDLVKKELIDGEDYKQLGLIGATKDAANILLDKYWGNPSPPDENLKNYRRFLLALVVNWRSYIFGADGQGVEHSDVEVESARMALMLTYQLIDVFEKINLEIPIKERIEDLAEFFRSISEAYWNLTIGDCSLSTLSEYKIEKFHGFKSPQSVVLVKAGRITHDSPKETLHK